MSKPYEVNVSDEICWAISRSAMRPRLQLREDIDRWFEAQGKSCPPLVLRPNDPPVLQFDDPDTAMAFKLRWC